MKIKTKFLKGLGQSESFPLHKMKTAELLPDIVKPTISICG